MKRLALLAVLVAGCDDDGPMPLPEDDADGYCTVVATMDRLCPEWRDESRDYAEGCFSASYDVAKGHYGSNIWQDVEWGSPDPDACLD